MATNTLNARETGIECAVVRLIYHGTWATVRLHPPSRRTRIGRCFTSAFILLESNATDFEGVFSRSNISPITLEKSLWTHELSCLMYKLLQMLVRSLIYVGWCAYVAQEGVLCKIPTGKIISYVVCILTSPYPFRLSHFSRPPTLLRSLFPSLSHLSVSADKMGLRDGTFRWSTICPNTTAQCPS